jgi:hypothetical protein
MAEKATPEQTGVRATDSAPQAPPADLPLPADPGGAHAKGYSADPMAEPDVPATGPLPLAPGPDTHPAVQQPERDGKVQPTGRSEPKPEAANDRLLGAGG